MISPTDGSEMRRISDVFDCWFESGSMPYAQDHYPFEHKERFDNNYPAQFIAEGLDQTRGWFYSLLAVSTTVFDNVAYKRCLSLGHILDNNFQQIGNFMPASTQCWVSWLTNEPSNVCLLVTTHNTMSTNIFFNNWRTQERVAVFHWCRISPFYCKNWSKYRFQPPECRVRGPLKSPKRANNEFSQDNDWLLCSSVLRYNFKRKIRTN